MRFAIVLWVAILLSACEDKQELALRAFEGGDYKEALGYFTELSQLDRQNWHHLFNVGRSLEELGRFNEAVSWYGKSLKYNEDANEILIARARCLLRVEYLEGAKTDLWRVLARDQDNYEANYLMGRVFMAENDPWSALTYYEKAMNSNSGDVNLYYHKAIVLGTIGHTYSAMKDLNYVIAQRPDFDHAYFNRAILQMRSGRYRAAIEDFDRAEHLSYAPAELYIRRADSKTQLGMRQAACNDYHTAAQLDAKNYQPVYEEMCGAR